MKKCLRDNSETGGFLIELMRIFECFLGQGQGFSGEKKQRKSGIYEESVKKEGCEFARNAVLSKNVLPLYIFDSRFMQAKRKCLNALFFSRVLLHKTMFFFYFPFMLKTFRFVFQGLRKAGSRLIMREILTGKENRPV